MSYGTGAALASLLHVHSTKALLEEEPRGPHPSLLDCLLLTDFGGRGTTAFSCVPPGDPHEAPMDSSNPDGPG